jgi:predicted MFS family arabinose efflux permease
VAGAVGIIAAFTAAGAGLGIVVAGPIVEVLDYHWLFWIPMIGLGIASVAARIFVPASPVRTPGRVNPSAAALLSAWLIALILGISEAPTWGWASGKVVGLLIAAVVLGAVWVWVESRSSQPLIDMRMMRIPTVWTTNLVALLLGVGMYAVFAFLPEFLQTPSSAGYGFGVSITHSGLLMLPSSIFMFALSMMSGRLSKRYGPKAILEVGLLISIITFLLLTVARSAQWEIVAAMVIQGIGFGLAFAALSNLVVAAVPAQQTGVASGMNANIRTIGGSIGAAVMSSIVTSRARADGLPRASGYTHGFALLTVAAVAAALAAFLVPRTRYVPSSDQTRAHGELGLVAAGTLAGDQPE